MCVLFEKSEKPNKDISTILFECSLLFITLLLNQYKAKAINKSDFANHTIKKINYIKNNFDIVHDKEKRLSVENLINECNDIINAY
jgi:hypothetical protein